MRYFEDINNVLSFLEGKGIKNKLFLKEENNNIFIEFKISSPNGKEENVSLKLNSEKSDDKQDNSYLANKVYILEKKVEELNNELKKVKEI